MLKVTPEEVGLLRAVADGLAWTPEPLDAVLNRLEAEVRRQADLLAAGDKPKDMAVLMDGDTRHTLLSWKDSTLDVDEHELILPWYFLKELAAGVLTYEESTLPGTSRLKQIKQQVAANLQNEAQAEKARLLAALAPTPAPAQPGQTPGVDL